MTTEPKVFRITSSFFGTTHLADGELLGAVLRPITSDLVFRPTAWGWDEREFRPLELDAILRDAAHASDRGKVLFLHRQQEPKYWASLHLGRKPHIYFEIDKGVARKHYQRFFGLADSIAETFRPDIGVVHIWPQVSKPWRSEDDRDANLMYQCAGLLPVDYYQIGPRGLGMRTYLGPHYIRQLGAAVLKTLPADVQEQAWGGVRVDVLPRPWEAPVGDLLAAWRRAMAHLRPADVFATPTTRDNRSVSWTRGTRCEIGGVLPT